MQTTTQQETDNQQEDLSLNLTWSSSAQSEQMDNQRASREGETEPCVATASEAGEGMLELGKAV